jgi:hypothetical protein
MVTKETIAQRKEKMPMPTFIKVAIEQEKVYSSSFGKSGR